MSRLPWIVLGMFVIVAALAREMLLGPSGILHVTFLGVGQGDSALIVTPSGRQIVIDGGPDASALSELKRRMPLTDRSIDMLVLSHGDLDHIAAFPRIVEAYDIGVVLMTGIPSENDAYPALLQALADHHVPILRPDPATDLDLGDGVTLDVVWPPAVLTKEHLGDAVNDGSIVLRLLYRDHAILFTGDIEEAAERAILASGRNIDANVLKVPHHGSKTSSSTGFLLAVSPQQAVISAGRRNRYGHPHKGILDRYSALRIPVVTTMSGSVEMVFP